jgi:hypothetical protein
LAKDDWAIVVGIRSYFDPDLAGLEGPENDARDFYDWVVAGNGGAVPVGQAKLIRSSEYGPPFASAASAMPTAEAIKLAFDHLRSIADANESKGLGRIVGGRLYLFFAGHGFAPAQDDNLTALLTAEASIDSARLSHIVGPYIADYFRRAKFFDEILMFMDCCREVMECAQLDVPYPAERASNFHEVRRFYAYGARVAKASREWKMGDGQYHGVFTKTLLDALGGTASDPTDPSIITAESLSNQLYNGFKGFMSDADKRNPDVPTEPEVDYEHKPSGNFTIVKRSNAFIQTLGLAKVPTYPVTIRVSAPLVGKKATIRNQDLQPIREETLVETTIVPLERGFYSIDIPEALERLPFEVTGGNTELHV